MKYKNNKSYFLHNLKIYKNKYKSCIVLLISTTNNEDKMIIGSIMICDNMFMK